MSDMLRKWWPARVSREVWADRLRAFYRCAHGAASGTDLSFQRCSSRPFLKWHGDHIILVLTRQGS